MTTMKKVRRVFAALLLSCTLWGSVANADAYYYGTGNSDMAAVGRVYYQYSESSDMMRGSGFFIKGGYFVTNYHVGYNHPEMKILEGEWNPGDYAIMGELVKLDKGKDLALYKTNAVDHWYLELAEALNTSGQFRTYGNGVDPGEHFADKTGYLMQKDYYADITYEYGNMLMKVNRFSFTSYGGSSGSAVLDSSDKVVGVVTGSVNADHTALVISLEDLKNFLKGVVENEG